MVLGTEQRLTEQVFLVKQVFLMGVLLYKVILMYLTPQPILFLFGLMLMDIKMQVTIIGHL